MTITSLPRIPDNPVEPESQYQSGQVFAIAGGHFVHDIYTAFVATLLPLLVEKFSLTLTLAGSLSAMVQVPAVLSPFVGYAADRLSLRYLVIFAPAATATFISLLGLAPSYGLIVALLLLTGLSVTAFHSPAAPMIGRLAGDRVGRGMSIFMAGGELGRTIGPLLVVWAVTHWTLEGIWPLMIVGWVASGILYLRLRTVPARSAIRQGMWEFLRKARRLLLPLGALILIRAFLLTCFTDYLPLYMSLVEKASLVEAGTFFAIFQVTGVAGALLSGTVSDTFGRRNVILFATLASALLMGAFLTLPGGWVIPILLLMGLIALSITPVLLAMVQVHFTENRATAHGMFLLMAFSSRPVAAFLIGLFADQVGLRTAFAASGAMQLLAVPVILLLPAVADKQS